MADGQSMERLHRRLVERRAMLLRQVSQTEDELRVLDSDAPPEMEEGAQEARLADVLASMDDRSKAEIVAIDRALALIDSGDYGICEDCGEDIPVARLEALPTAAMCVTCAETYEAAIRGRTPNRNGRRTMYDLATLSDGEEEAE
jgi:RNA polymerase-binding transcription factor